MESTLVHSATGIHQYVLYLEIHVCHRDAPSVRAACMNAPSARTAFRMQGASGCIRDVLYTKAAFRVFGVS